MTLLQFDGVSFGYGGEILFREVTFTLGAGERLGLVAPNGAGKTTLLKLLAGELQPDEGRVIIPRDAKIAYVKQSHEPNAVGTVLDALLSGFADLVALRHEIHDASEASASGDERALERLASAQDRYEVAGGHALEHRVQALAGDLGFGPEDMDRPIVSLSGGERGRLALGIAIASEPRLLLLDEPTNHLDLPTTERLEKILRAFGGAVVIVSHDRAFLDATCNRTGELGSRRFRLYHAPYSEYVVLREADLERENAALERQRDEIARTEDFIRRNIAGQKTKQAQSRRKALAKLERLERPEDVWSDAKKMAFRFADAPRSGDIVLEATKVGASRGGRRLFSGVDLLLRRGSRIGIVGPNGAGKTTLLKILAQKGMPEDEGEVRFGSNVLPAYFDQHLESLDPAASGIDEIRKVRGDLVVDAVRTYLARFKIVGDDPFRAVGSFSGGERTRLALAKMLLVPRNLLFLDEPTNHLDIPSSEILEEALAGFDGAVVLVSHDRYFLDEVCTHVLHLEGAHVTIYPGGWSDFRDAQAKGSSLVQKREADAAAKAARAAAAQEKAGREQYEKQKAARREQERKQRRAAELEKGIARTEKEVGELKQKLLAGSQDWEELAKMAEQERALQKKLDQMMDEWSRLAEEVGT